MAKKTAKKAASEKAAAKKAPAKKKVAKKATAEKTAAKKAPAKKKAAKRTRAAKEVRLKAFWGVFSQSLRRVAIFDYNQKKQAEKKAQELSKDGKSPHFVQLVKEVIEG